MQPVNAVAFVLDGALIGAGDMRCLAWAMVGAAAVFIPAALVVGLDAGVGGLWAALGLLMAPGPRPCWPGSPPTAGSSSAPGAERQRLRSLAWADGSVPRW
jgi:hypothetical protein